MKNTTCQTHHTVIKWLYKGERKRETMTNTLPNEHFYISSELSEVIDLIFERKQLLNDIGLAIHTNNPYDMLNIKCQQVTTKLETLIKKED